MRFSIASVLALATAVLAQDATPGFNVFKTPAKDEKVAAGSTYAVEWTYNTALPGAISIELYGGASPTTLQLVDNIAAGVDAKTGTYSWAVDSSLGSLATYGLKIVLDSDPKTFQWGNPFQITGGGKTSSSSKTTVTGTSTSTGTGTSTSASETETETETSTTKSASSTHVSTKATSSTITTVTNGGNHTTVAPPKSTITTFATTQLPATTTSSTTTAVSTAGANIAAAGSFAALFGGVAMAVFAL